MDIGTISVRYAKALITYAREEGVEDTLFREMEALSNSFNNHPKLREALQNPMLKATEKQNLIVAATVGRAQASPAFMRFVGLVLKAHRESYLQFICLTYMSLYYKLKHIAVAKLTTAVPVDPDTETRIRDAAAMKVHAKMKLRTVVDPSIEGGFIFDLNDYRLDASVATQLKRMKQQFIDKNKRIV